MSPRLAGSRIRLTRCSSADYGAPGALSDTTDPQSCAGPNGAREWSTRRCVSRSCAASATRLRDLAARHLTRTRSELLAENASLRRQDIVLRRNSERPRLHRDDHLLVLVLARLTRQWRDSLHLLFRETLRLVQHAPPLGDSGHGVLESAKLERERNLPGSLAELPVQGARPVSRAWRTHRRRGGPTDQRERGTSPPFTRRSQRRRTAPRASRA
jgi:hypothetical protein